MKAFWEEKIIKYNWGNLIITRCSNCEGAPLDSQEYEVLTPYCSWCGCKMTNAEEE